MQGESESIGWSLAFEFTPAAIFGSAVGFSTATVLALPPLSMSPLAAGAAAFGGAWIGLQQFGSRKRPFPLAEFDRSEFDRSEFDRELSAVTELLVQADVSALVEQLAAPASSQAEDANELILEDVLALDTGSRVVRLFELNDTAGEMQARIDDHLRFAPRQVPPDATQELHDALAALRRSLR